MVDNCFFNKQRVHNASFARENLPSVMLTIAYVLPFNRRLPRQSATVCFTIFDILRHSI